MSGSGVSVCNEMSGSRSTVAEDRPASFGGADSKLGQGWLPCGKDGK
jgi:hypothetical protein